MSNLTKDNAVTGKIHSVIVVCRLPENCGFAFVWIERKKDK